MLGSCPIDLFLFLLLLLCNAPSVAGLAAIIDPEQDYTLEATRRNKVTERALSLWSGDGDAPVPVDVAVFVNGADLDVGGGVGCCAWNMQRVKNFITSEGIDEKDTTWCHFSESPCHVATVSGTASFVREGTEYLNTLPPGSNVYLIGHSYGGDSVLALVEAYHRSNVNFRLVATLDPVGTAGFRAAFRSNRSAPSHIEYFYNRWQMNSVFPFDVWESGRISCSARTCDQSENNFHRNADGSNVMESCSWHENCEGKKLPNPFTGAPGSNGTKQKRVIHQSIAWDGFVEAQLISIIDRFQPRCGGSARDVSVGGVNGDVWIVDNDRIPQSNVLGGMIRRHTGGTTWDSVVPHVRAIRIAVAPDGTVWYVDGIGDVYSVSGNTVVKRGGSARTVAVGANGDVWIVDNEQISESNWAGGMIRRNTGGTSWNEIRTDIRAVEIAVAPDGSLWMVNGIGEVHALLKSEGFLKLVGGSARDIAVGATGEVWIVDNDAIAESNADGGMIRRYTGGTSWGDLRSQVRAVRIAVAPDGTVWTVNGRGIVTTPLRSGADVACLPRPTPAPRPRPTPSPPRPAPRPRPTPFPPRPAPRPRPTPSPPRKRNFLVENKCRGTTIRLAIRYKDVSGDWVSKCWWTLDPGDRFYLSSGGQRLETTNSAWYFYAKSIDGNIVWSGTDSDAITRSCNGQSLDMSKTEYIDSSGRFYKSFRCNEESSQTTTERQPTPSPPRPRPRPTPRPPTPSNNLWAAYDGYACRVQGSDSGKKGVDFEKYEGDHVDFGWCMSRCEGWSYCKGFEYRYDNEEGIGKCEIWLLYYGNVEEYIGPNYHYCYWKKKSNGGGGGGGNISWKKRSDTACGFGGDGVENIDFLKRSDVSREWCKNKCLEMGDSCHGYDYAYDKERCRVFYRKTTHNVDKDGVDCWLRAGGDNTQDYWIDPIEDDGAGAKPSSQPLSAGDTWKKHSDTACGFGGDGEEDRDFLKRTDVSKEWCKNKCLEMGSSCHGYDYDYGKERCRVFYRKTTDNVDKDGVDCWLKQAPSNTVISPNRDGDCASREERSQNCGAGPSQPVSCCEPDRGCDGNRCK